jgi:hypothetical protein
MKPKPKSRYVDRPELLEQFADSVRGVTFDGQTIRIELCIERHDPSSLTAAKSSSPMCRLVLTPDAAIELREKLGRAISALK